MANLQIVERRNHQFVTSYLPAGRDATVVWGSQDFKFKNTRKYPVRITATVQGGIATVQVWGKKEEVEYDVDIVTSVLSSAKDCASSLYCLASSQYFIAISAKNSARLLVKRITASISGVESSNSPP